jgi:hypothetical protein
MPEQLRSLFGFVWEFGANLLFLIAWQSSQPIRARIANFQKAFNALSARRQKYFVWRPRFSHPPGDFWRRAVGQTVHDIGEKNEEKIVCLEWRFYDRPRHCGTLGDKGN